MGADGVRRLARQQRRRCEFAVLRDTRNASASRPACCAAYWYFPFVLCGLVVLLDLDDERQSVPHLDRNGRAVFDVT